MRTQASISYSLGNRFYSFEFITIISRFITFIPLVSVRDTPLPTAMCRNVTLRSPNSTCQFVTPDPLILRVGSWHPIPKYHSIDSSILLLYQGIINLITLVHQAFFNTKASSLTRGFQDLGFNSFIMLISSQLYNHNMQKHN